MGRKVEWCGVGKKVETSKETSMMRNAGVFRKSWSGGLDNLQKFSFYFFSSRFDIFLALGQISVRCNEFMGLSTKV